jgi:AcrR family transcriptional regulator
VSSQDQFGRQKQRHRTRADLLRAARRIIEQGGQPTVAEVADAAGISRATAYRYFSKPAEMVREALLDAVADAIQTTLPVPNDADGPQDVATQLDVLVRQVSAMVGAHEGMFRHFLANSLTDPTDMRRGSRRLDWLGTVLLPLKPSLPPADLRRLLYALSLLTGIETLVVLRDICHLSTAQAESVVRWAAQALLSRAVEEANAKPAVKQRRAGNQVEQTAGHGRSLG